MAQAKGINANMIKWFREKTGYTLGEAAKKIGVKIEKLKSWEEGATLPTIKQAMKMGNIYKTPWAAFFLRKKPQFRILEDFRTIYEGCSEKYSPEK